MKSWKENLKLRLAPQTDATQDHSAEKEPVSTTRDSPDEQICGIMQLVLQPLQIKTHHPVQRRLFCVYILNNESLLRDLIHVQWESA